MVKPAGLLSNRYRLEDMPDLSGKVAVVTGGSRGIGEAAVTALVQKGCEGKSLFLFLFLSHIVYNRMDGLVLTGYSAHHLRYHGASGGGEG